MAQFDLAARRDTWRCEPWLVSHHRSNSFVSPAYVPYPPLENPSVLDGVNECLIEAKIGKEAIWKSNEKGHLAYIYLRIRSDHLLNTRGRCSTTFLLSGISFIDRHHRLISIVWVVNPIHCLAQSQNFLTYGTFAEPRLTLPLLGWSLKNHDWLTAWLVNTVRPVIRSSAFKALWKPKDICHVSMGL